jgi:type 1 fimbriae regulatory protein FimB/type 1 fimbriae regulatory protein FimE
MKAATMVLLAYRHGLRPVELVTLRWEAIDFRHGQIHVNGAKNGSPSVRPLSGNELRPLRRLIREQEPPSPFVFTSERGSPFTTAGWRKMVARLGVAAKLGFATHLHMLRHACGFQLANQGTDTRTLQAYLGHRNIQHTVRYTELSPNAVQKSVARLDSSRRTSPAPWRIACPCLARTRACRVADHQPPPKSYFKIRRDV